MNLSKKKQSPQPSKHVEELLQKKQEIAHRLYQHRQMTNEPGCAESDWAKAEWICKNPRRKALFWLNQSLICLEKQVVEPMARWVEHADLFRIIERLSPTLEALGVIAIPIVLFFATQGYEESLRQQELERIRQQTVNDYLNQLSSILFSLDGNFDDPQNTELRTLMTATTITLLQDPNLDGNRKGQILSFLSQMNLVQREIVYGPQRPTDKSPAISLFRANLNNTYLLGIDLSGTDLSLAKLVGANLFGANLIEANLIGANLRLANLRLANLTFGNLESAYLMETDFSGADLTGANLRGVDLSDSDLTVAEIRGVDFSHSNLSRANLSGVDFSGINLTGTNLEDVKDLTPARLEGAYLCETQLPKGFDFDPNRDCNKPWHPFMEP